MSDVQLALAATAENPVDSTHDHVGTPPQHLSAHRADIAATPSKTFSTGISDQPIALLASPAPDAILLTPAIEALAVYRLLDRRVCQFLLTEFLITRLPRNELILCTSARQVLCTRNAGGSSIWSEVIAMELLHRIFGAELLKTETTISYVRQSCIVDFIVSINQHRFGISVTRVMQLQRAEQIQRLLVKKLKGLSQAIDHVSEADAWERGLLHVLVTSSADAEIVASQFTSLSPSFHRIATLLITVVHNAAWIFTSISKKKPKQQIKQTNPSQQKL